MTRIVVIVPESKEIEAKRFLVYRNSNASWYTDWAHGKGYLTIVEFYNQEEAVEFQLKFLGNIDYQSS